VKAEENKISDQCAGTQEREKKQRKLESRVENLRERKGVLRDKNL